MMCPYCEQGVVISARLKKNGKIIHICEECDTVWEGEINLQTGVGFETYMMQQGCANSWEELEI